jgi:hypothetical protein
MEILLTNLLAIAFVLLVGAVVYILIAPEMHMATNNTAVDDMIQKCISDSWQLQSEINYSTTKTELQAWYWEVEHFESTYTNLVPDQFLKQQSDRLYMAITQRRDQLVAA